MTKFVQSKDVAWNFLGEKIIAFNLSGEKQFHDLNETAAVIFRALQAPATRPELIAALIAEFDVDESLAAGDVDAALSDMQTKRLIVEA
jgi:hypothetical protein